VADRQLIDPLRRAIVLHDHTWYGHIIKGHPEVAAQRAQVEQAISNPEAIQFSASDPDCRIYYGAPSSAGIRFAVVADVVAGVVKTAYRARRKKVGGMEWSR
jgi:hypothetical protein